MSKDVFKIKKCKIWIDSCGFFHKSKSEARKAQNNINSTINNFLNAFENMGIVSFQRRERHESFLTGNFNYFVYRDGNELINNKVENPYVSQYLREKCGEINNFSEKYYGKIKSKMGFCVGNKLFLNFDDANEYCIKNKNRASDLEVLEFMNQKKYRKFHVGEYDGKRCVFFNIKGTDIYDIFVMPNNFLDAKFSSGEIFDIQEVIKNYNEMINVC